jgi:Ser/Thr protein kinase RdoA (MazF antagonist)
VSVTRLDGGSGDIYRIDLQNCANPLVLKTYADEPAWTPAKEALVAGWLDRDLGVSIPRWLSLDESRTVLPRRFAIMTWLAGRMVKSLVGEPDVDAVYRQMGALLRRIHEIRMDAYGYIVADGVWRGQAGNAEYAISTFERLLRRFRNQGGDEQLARRMEKAAGARFDLLEFSSGPVLCHDDFQQGNLLASRGDDGRLRLTGLIDFGNALAGDAISDLAKTLFCCAHEDPRSYEPVLHGYGPIHYPEPREALWLYTMFHRLTMWTWLTSHGVDPAATGPMGLIRDLDLMMR